MYEVKRVEGKGFGCIATKDIKKGDLILSENPQIPDVHNRPNDIWGLMESFNQLNEADRLEYMTLHDKYDDLQALPSYSQLLINQELLDKKSRISFMFGEDTEKVLKIYRIYESNCFDDGVSIKASRFNHSCDPNTSFVVLDNVPDQIRAISNIKKGEEITINYLSDWNCSMRNREFRQASLLKSWHFICLCDLCENGADDIDDTLEELIAEAGEYHKQCHEAFKASLLERYQYYPLELCRREIRCYRQIYKLAKDKKLRPISLFRVIERAFATASLGYQMYKAEDLQHDCENFARAAEKFEKILGKVLVNKGITDFWKPFYENFELHMSKQPYGFVYYRII